MINNPNNALRPQNSFHGRSKTPGYLLACQVFAKCFTIAIFAFASIYHPLPHYPSFTPTRRKQICIPNLPKCFARQSAEHSSIQLARNTPDLHSPHRSAGNCSLNRMWQRDQSSVNCRPYLTASLTQKISHQENRIRVKLARRAMNTIRKNRKSRLVWVSWKCWVNEKI